MAINVIDPIEKTTVPFLRGILTRSLQNAGMRFNDAYKIANVVRNELSNKDEISVSELTAYVIKTLEKAGYSDLVERYRGGTQPHEHITVIGRNKEPKPFSKATLTQSLEICAFPREECFSIAAAIEQQLLNKGVRTIHSVELGRFTHDYLAHNEPSDMASRYLSWMAFTRDSRPLVLLLGGTTGSGKSTISADIAHRLDIVRTQSTDMLREVMRLLVPERLMPELHTSSFNAWQTLPSWDHKPVSFQTHFIEGYLAQARAVGVGLEGVMKRAEREQLSLILEGVHIFPEMQKRIRERREVIVVPIIISVHKRKQLRRQLEGRGRQISLRRAERYLASFEAIWKLQDFLVAEAETHDIPIIPNEDVAQTVQLVMDAIGERLLNEYKVKAAEFFA